MASMKHQLSINGKRIDAIKGGFFPTINPATEEGIGVVAEGNKEDIDVAVYAAKTCLNGPNWGYASTGEERAVVLRRIGHIILSRIDELAELESLDQGKPLRDALKCVSGVAKAFDYYASLAQDLDLKQNEVIENGLSEDFSTSLVYEPIGIVGAITSWNFPLNIAAFKISAALAAGCCVVLKPSEHASLSCLLLADICTEAGLPDGALNVVTGFGETAGEALCLHKDVDKVTFTGSVPVGMRVMANASKGPVIKGVVLELGGKSPMIIFDDADLESAVEWVMVGFLYNTGQCCSSTSRVLCQKSIRKAFLTKLMTRMKDVKIGDSLCKDMLNCDGPVMGPIITKVQYDKVWQYIDEAKKEGYSFLYGGERTAMKKETITGSSSGESKTRPGTEEKGMGFFIGPTVLIDVPTTSRIWTEEIFGPVLCIREFGTEDEAVLVSNDSLYGLAASVMSKDPLRCDRVAHRLRAGTVWKNSSQVHSFQAPWGGVKNSGIGREQGLWGLEEYIAVKTVTGCKSGFSLSSCGKEECI